MTCIVEKQIPTSYDHVSMYLGSSYTLKGFMP